MQAVCGIEGVIIAYPSSIITTLHDCIQELFKIGRSLKYTPCLLRALLSRGTDNVPRTTEYELLCRGSLAVVLNLIHHTRAAMSGTEIHLRREAATLRFVRVAAVVDILFITSRLCAASEQTLNSSFSEI